MGTLVGLFTILLGMAVAVVLAIFGAIMLVKFFKLIGALVSHTFRFIIGMVGDAFRAVGAVVLGLVLAPLVLLNVVIGRWSAAGHFGRALKNEFKTCCLSMYRVLIGHPFRFLGLAGVTEGLEKRLPQVIAEAPGADRPSKRRVGMFNGYTIIGSLPGGGSGGRLYIAEPDELKLAAFARQGLTDVHQVVIKSFSLSDGSSLPQIVRESRALDAAKKMGLVFEHELSDERFFYVMRYVPGESLATLTMRMHGLSPAEGLSDHYLSTSLGYAVDLLQSLNTYHRGGLWHKDVKPDNIIVDGHKAHLVDFGLVTPLRSAMTLTTHGTEYFRDPELVRQALRGVKVHQIDGTKFDIYAAGAVLFSVIENSFPAHGGLSQITKRCPEAVRWIVRRAMADYDKRYASAAEMLADLNVVLAAADPFKVRPADLPSMSQGPVEWDAEPAHSEPMAVAYAATPVPPPLPRGRQTPQPPPVGRPTRPRLAVRDWWTGRYAMADDVNTDAPTPAPIAIGPSIYNAARTVKSGARAKAADQVRAARARAAARRRTAQQRINSLRHRRRPQPIGVNIGTAAGIVLGLLMFASLGAVALLAGSHVRTKVSAPYAIDSWEVPDTSVEAEASAPSVIVDAAGPELDPLNVLAGRTVLVVSDLAVPHDRAIDAQLRSLLSRLNAAGAEVMGDGPALLGSPGPDESAQIALVADVEAARGQRTVDSSDFFQTMHGWLISHPDVDALLWIAPPRAGSSGIVYAAVTGSSMRQGSADRDIENTLVRVMRDAGRGLN